MEREESEKGILKCSRGYVVDRLMDDCLVTRMQRISSSRFSKSVFKPKMSDVIRARTSTSRILGVYRRVSFGIQR